MFSFKTSSLSYGLARVQIARPRLGGRTRERAIVDLVNSLRFRFGSISNSHSLRKNEMPLPHSVFQPDQTSPILDRAKQILAPELVPPVLVVTTEIEASKQRAAWAAVDKHILPHHSVIGIGSGSTVPYVVERIVAQGPQANRHRVFIPTGFQSKELIVAANLRLGDVDQYPVIDVTVDGADEVDKDLNAIKGGGACHLREKVLAEAADTFIIVADYRKKSEYLGTNWKAGVPVEVAPFAYAKVLQNLVRLGSQNPALRMGKAKAGPVVSDNGNFIIDAPFSTEDLKDPLRILKLIKMLTGVVEVGLFCHMAQAAYFGNADGSLTVRWADGNVEDFAKGDEVAAQ